MGRNGCDFYIGLQSTDVEWVGMEDFYIGYQSTDVELKIFLPRLSVNRCRMRKFSTSFIVEPM